MTSLDALRTSLAERYIIERELGQGGMATVYLAQDVRHDRRVALKVLKPELAAVLGAERFVVEIKTTAALQHPHILPLFDSGTAGGFLFYVMPFIEGETLRTRLDRETQLSVDDAVSLTCDVADALDYAHRHGVIHRDIKPENILLHDGRPMVADFGIALAVSAAAGGRMTETGLSLGTPHYMSPEQATAEKELTGRSDIYSLGSVLFEMLTGNPPHTGASAQQIIMKIVTETAQPVTALRPRVPANVAAAVSQALEKLPADRFASAAEFAAALRNPGFLPSGTVARTAWSARPGAGRSRVTPILAGVALVATVAAAWGWLRPAPEQPVSRYGLTLDRITRTRNVAAPIAAADGSFLVYLGEGEGLRSQVWLKRRDQRDGAPIPGTLGAVSLALSPDGSRVAFVAEDQLKTVSLNGGGAVTLLPSGVSGPGGLAWLESDTIAYLGRGLATLEGIPARGGTPVVLWRSDLPLRFPNALPGGRGVLLTRCDTGCSVQNLWVVDRRADTAFALVNGALGGVYAPSGHLLYRNHADGRFTAIGFDLDRLQVTGFPLPLEGQPPNRVGQPFRISANGTLLMLGGGPDADDPRFELVWVDRAGAVSPLDSSWVIRLTASAGNHGWSLSPDGSRLAIGLNTDQGDDIWIKQLPAGPLTRLTFAPTPEYRPRWTADGRSVTFTATGARPGLYLRRADGTGTDSLLYSGPIDEGVRWPGSPWLVLRPGNAADAPGGRDIRGLRGGIDTATVPLIATRFDETAIEPSPDGRWLAYVSDESGTSEVYVRPFPQTDGGKWPISAGGGISPRWSRDGREIFYIDPRNTPRMMVVRVSGTDALTVGRPEPLFDLTDGLLTRAELRYYTPWDVGPDGRFLLSRARDQQGAVATGIEVTVVENFFRELRELGRQ